MGIRRAVEPIVASGREAWNGLTNARDFDRIHLLVFEWPPSRAMDGHDFFRVRLVR